MSVLGIVVNAHTLHACLYLETLMNMSADINTRPCQQCRPPSLTRLAFTMHMNMFSRELPGPFAYMTMTLTKHSHHAAGMHDAGSTSYNVDK